MNIDWKKVGAAGSIITGAAIIHGLTTRNWRRIHTFGLVLGIVAAVAPFLKRESTGAAEES